MVLITQELTCPIHSLSAMTLQCILFRKSCQKLCLLNIVTVSATECYVFVTHYLFNQLKEKEVLTYYVPGAVLDPTGSTKNGQMLTSSKFSIYLNVSVEIW